VNSVDERTFQLRSSHAEDAVVEHADGGDALVQRVLREVAAVQLDFRQLGHGKEVYDGESWEKSSGDDTSLAIHFFAIESGVRWK